MKNTQKATTRDSAQSRHGSFPATFVLILCAAAFALLILGNYHIVTGTRYVSGIDGVELMPREIFGYSEVYIDADAIVRMPALAAMVSHPVGYQALIDRKAGSKSINSQAAAKADSMEVTSATRPIAMNGRYTTNGMEVTDTQTNLVWRRCPEGQDWRGNDCSGQTKNFSHYDADDYAANQPESNGIQWRVPTKNELLTLVMKEGHPPFIDVVAFGKSAAGSSMHKDPDDTSSGQSISAVDFTKGESTRIFGDGIPLRLVRNNR